MPAMTCSPVNSRQLRFEFGRNWQHFLDTVGEPQIRTAEKYLVDMLGRDSLDGVRFLDIGSGSGLSSLAARRLGADVVSFDYDKNAVSCTTEMRRQFTENEGGWAVHQGSILDSDFISGLGKYDVVHAWGVLHHTGDMWRAMEFAGMLVGQDGSLMVAIYNDQGFQSRIWRLVKRIYNFAPSQVRPLIVVPIFLLLWGPVFVCDTLRGNPLARWKTYTENRGMSPWHDVVDWVGGYPFEVARPDEIFDFFSSRRFTLTKIQTCGGKLGCNEFVFKRH